MGEETFYLRQIRISGEDITVLRMKHDEDFQVSIRTYEGETFQLGNVPNRPSYTDLENMSKARPGSVAAMDWVSRLKYEVEWTKTQGFKNPVE